MGIATHPASSRAWFSAAATTAARAQPAAPVQCKCSGAQLQRPAACARRRGAALAGMSAPPPARRARRALPHLVTGACPFSPAAQAGPQLTCTSTPAGAWAPAGCPPPPAPLGPPRSPPNNHAPACLFYITVRALTCNGGSAPAASINASPRAARGAFSFPQGAKRPCPRTEPDPRTPHRPRRCCTAASHQEPVAARQAARRARPQAAAEDERIAGCALWPRHGFM
jgi:hypothetical protein